MALGKVEEGARSPVMWCLHAQNCEPLCYRSALARMRALLLPSCQFPDVPVYRPCQGSASLNLALQITVTESKFLSSPEVFTCSIQALSLPTQKLSSLPPKRHSTRQPARLAENSPFFLMHSTEMAL